MKSSFATYSLCTSAFLAAAALFGLASFGSGQTTTPDGMLLPTAPKSASMAAITATDQTATAQGVVVSATPAPTPYDNWTEKRNHLMPEVSGTEITVTKKATVIKLDQQPPVENNDVQELFNRAPGLLITEQHTPGQFNFSYRGLGNPQESEFVTVLMDGVPLASDWIGFPTLYFLPLPQSVSQIDFIRGGGSLLYGPEPAPAVNFMTRHPAPGSPWNFYTEQIGGANGLYSTYNVIQEASGPFEVRLDGGYVRTDGQRDNSWYDLWQTNGYFGYRPDENQLWAVDVHVSRFNGGDPGQISYEQFLKDQNFSPQPNAEDWVDRYSVVLRHEHDFGDGWLFQGKVWFTNQDIDSRGAPRFSQVQPPPAPPTMVVPLSIENFWNGGADLRVRKNWGEDTIFKGSTLTLGGVVYHGEGPFQQWVNPNLDASRNDGGIPTLNQDRSSDYQAFFGEDLIRLGKFHIVGSFRLDHETVDVDTNVGRFGPGTADADHWVPLWGVGIGNDFGHMNESYFSASSGWRPTRWFDIASPFQHFSESNRPDPFHSLDFELGVHGTPYKGFWYDAGLFWMVFDNRTETLPIPGEPGVFFVSNSGSSRNRGFEGELSYDFMELIRGSEPANAQDGLSRDGKDEKQMQQSPAFSFLADWHLVVFSNVQLLDAVFTESETGLVGNTPAFAPDILWKGGITLRKDKCFDISLTAVYVSDEFWSDANASATPFPGQLSTPAKIPAYKVLDLSGDWYITRHCKLIAGISNLTNEKYYSRVFFGGQIEPAPQRSAYAGLSLEF
jgi:Fe(3+) dicitrate transport protein